MENNSNQSGERGHRDHSQGEGTKSDRQGGGPGERSSMAGEQGAKAETDDKSTRSHTEPGEVRGHGTLKDGSSNDQVAEERGTGLHLGDDYRIDRLTGEQDETVRRQTGTANHSGNNNDGSGGGKSSGGAGHGPQSHTHAPDSSGSNNSSAERSSGSEMKMETNVNPKDYEGYEGGTPPGKLKSGGDHQHGGSFPPRTRQDPNQEGSSAGSHS
jgi:hypothetical protein